MYRIEYDEEVLDHVRDNILETYLIIVRATWKKFLKEGFGFVQKLVRTTFILHIITS